MKLFKVNDNCIGCMACVDNCPAKALKSEWKNAKAIIYHNISKCARCGLCWRICPEQAIEFNELLQGQWEEVERFPVVVCDRCGRNVCTEKQLKAIKEAGQFDEILLLCEVCRTAEMAGRLQKSGSGYAKHYSGVNS